MSNQTPSLNKERATRQRVARNFIRTYGRSQFRRLIVLLSRNESGQDIANEFNVSRERVRQWKNIFGVVNYSYRIYPEINAILQKP